MDILAHACSFQRVTFDVHDVFHTLESIDYSDFDFDPTEAFTCMITYWLDEKECVSH
jgi:hypothetical protein